MQRNHLYSNQIDVCPFYAIQVYPSGYTTPQVILHTAFSGLDEAGNSQLEKENFRIKNNFSGYDFHNQICFLTDTAMKNVPRLMFSTSTFPKISFIFSGIFLEGSHAANFE